MGSGSCLETHLEVLEAIWKYFTKNKNFEFFRFFQSKNEGFSYVLIIFLSMRMQKMTFLKYKYLIKNLIDTSFHLVLYFRSLVWWIIKWSLEKSFVISNLLKKAFFQALRALKLEKWNFKSQNRFSQNFFGVSIGCMGASKRCLEVRGVLRNPFGVIRSNLEAFYKKQKFWIFFDFFKQKMKDFLMFELDFWSWGCKKWRFFKK